MTEKQSQRDAIDRMTKHLVEHGKGTTAEQAKKIATEAAIRNDRQSEKK